MDQETEFVRFTTGDLSNPGAFHFGKPVSLRSQEPHYSGKVVILVDETTQSSAEYHSMAFRARPNAIVIGSTTAGADGNVSRFPLPGGASSMISGIGVFYPDKKPTQQIGIVPDIEARPTIAGIRAGRDEVLEVAVRQILGPEVPAAQIEKMIQTVASPAASRMERGRESNPQPTAWKAVTLPLSYPRLRNRNNSILSATASTATGQRLTRRSTDSRW